MISMDSLYVLVWGGPIEEIDQIAERKRAEQKVKAVCRNFQRFLLYG
jgi:hypothetical protein